MLVSILYSSLQSLTKKAFLLTKDDIPMNTFLLPLHSRINFWICFCFVFLQIKFYWNAVTFICLFSNYVCFHAMKTGLDSYDTDNMACQAQSIYSRVFYRACGLTPRGVTSATCIIFRGIQRATTARENMWREAQCECKLVNYHLGKESRKI